MTHAAPHDAYLETITGWQRAALDDIRMRLAALLPNSEEVMSYAIPGFRVNGKVLMGYAAYKNHCSLFPHSGSLLPHFHDELTDLGYKFNKGTLQFTENNPISDDLLARLVAKRIEMA
jgi:uncharacterized protein YdhG (YjbR/CyaY superfamily)